MSLRVTRLLTRLGQWLKRKLRQVQHTMSHCGVLSGRGTQTKCWTCNFATSGSSSTVIPKFFSSERGKTKWTHHSSQVHQPWQNMVDLLDSGQMQLSLQVTVSELANMKDFATTAEFYRNAIIPCMLLESFDCRSRSERPCAAKVQDNMCWMVGKIQWEVVTIHAVKVLVQNQPASGVQESSVQ